MVEIVDVEKPISVEALEWRMVEDSAVITLEDAELWVTVERVAKGKYALNLVLKVGNDIVSEASVSAKNPSKLMQPRYSAFRAAVRRYLPKGVRLGDLINMLQVKVAPQLIENYSKILERRREERRRKLQELLKKHGEELAPIIEDPIKHIMEVVNFYHVGDDVPKHQLLPVIVSRFLPREKRLHTVISGPSSLGKNNLIKAFKRVTPPKWWFELTRLTPTALDYMPKSLGRQILYIQEYEGMRQAAYSARITLSEGNLTVAYTKRNEKTGEFETVNKKIVGTPVLITTTTAISIDPDMENRTFYINPDPSEEQTRRIIEHILWLETNPEAKLQEKEIKRKAKLLKLFFMTLQKVDVIIPKDLANELVKDIPLVVRARRDVKKLLYAVEAIAALHQHKRERVEIDGKEYIIAAKEDVEYVKRWFKPFLTNQMLGITEHHKRILECIRGVTNNGRSYVTAKDTDLMACVGLQYRQLKRYLDDMVQKGVLTLDDSHRPHRYYLPEDAPRVKKLDDIQQMTTNYSEENINKIANRSKEEANKLNEEGVVGNVTNVFEESHTISVLRKGLSVEKAAKEILLELDRCAPLDEIVKELEKHCANPMDVIRVGLQDGIIEEKEIGGERYLCPPD